MMVFTVVPPFFLVEGLDLTSSSMGLVMAIAPVLGMLAGVPAGGLVDRFGSKRVTGVGLGLMTLASVFLATLPLVWAVVGFVCGAVFLTPGNQLFMAANNTSVMRRAPSQHQGRIAGMLNLSRNLGSVAGTATGSVVYDVVVSRAASSAAVSETVLDPPFFGQLAAFSSSAAAGAIALILWAVFVRRRAT
jgi:MFS family permease